MDHICQYVETNQVTWLDRHDRPLKFNRKLILKNVTITIESLRGSKRFEKGLSLQEVMELIDGKYYVLAIFDAIYNKCAEENGCKLWMCKSMGMSQYYEMLLDFYGKERLRFIYLVRDPRDVTLSFMKTPVGDCYPYQVSKKWAKLQNYALQILSDAPELVHQVRYEHVLNDKVGEVAKINDFMGCRGICKTLRRGSVVVLANDEQLSKRAKEGREATKAKGLSYQFQNLGRGESFAAKQFAKYLVEMELSDIQIVESTALEEMTRLGYEPHCVGKTHERIVFTEDLLREYDELNQQMLSKMFSDLEQDNPDDLHRRQRMASVLKKSRVHFRESFELMDLDRDDLLEETDDEDDIEDHFDVANIDFKQWPMKASQVGFLSRSKVFDRFVVEDDNWIKNNEDHLSLLFAASSQRGYYPSDRDKANQDAYISGLSLSSEGVLFGVFDGHGDQGDKCAIESCKVVKESCLEKMKGYDDKTQKKKSLFLQEMFQTSYAAANDAMKKDRMGDSSGTTAVVSMLDLKEKHLYVANVGDSRCIAITKNGDVKTLTKDHSPQNEEEKKRILSCGGLVMTSEQYDLQDDTIPTNNEPVRVWSSQGKYPGCAFSRSIGDFNAKELGVVADPEFINISLLDDESVYDSIVLGSDGIFDFMDDSDIAQVVLESTSPNEICRSLVGMSYNRWSENEQRTDDITVIVIKLHQE